MLGQPSKQSLYHILVKIQCFNSGAEKQPERLCPDWAVSVLIYPAIMGKGLAAVKNTSGRPEDIARDESFWFEIQQAYTADRSMINLNNGGVSPTPAIVQEAMKRHLDYSNTSSAYSMWRILEPQRESIRHRLARFFQCDTEEVAFTRNASEGLQILQNGFDLGPGDEVLTTTQDYPEWSIHSNNGNVEKGL